jgi:anti-sigma B factor antagonist
MTASQNLASRSVVKPEKDLVGNFVQEFRLKLKSIIEQGTREVVIDLEEVKMVDSTGIGLLVSTHNSLVKVGGRLEVINATTDLLDLFQWMRLHQHFNIRGNAQEGATS